MNTVFRQQSTKGGVYSRAIAKLFGLVTFGYRRDHSFVFYMQLG
ncbi:hypothetical protein ACEYW6_11000 [Nostoc sp. UIC 10607]